MFVEQNSGCPGHSGVKKSRQKFDLFQSVLSGSLDFSPRVPLWVQLFELSFSSPVLYLCLYLYVEFLITNLVFHFQKFYVDLSQNYPVNCIFYNLFLFLYII